MIKADARRLTQAVCSCERESDDGGGEEAPGSGNCSKKKGTVAVQKRPAMAAAKKRPAAARAAKQRPAMAVAAKTKKRPAAASTGGREASTSFDQGHPNERWVWNDISMRGRRGGNWDLIGLWDCWIHTPPAFVPE